MRELAQKQKSTVLTQLASRILAATRHGSQDDIFAKMKSLIADMIEKLNQEAEADATEKAFCDKELAETETKKADKEAAIDKLSPSRRVQRKTRSLTNRLRWQRRMTTLQETAKKKAWSLMMQPCHALQMRKV